MEIEKTLHFDFRKNIIKTFFIICTIVLIVEIAYGIVLWVGGDISTTIISYIFLRIIIPSLFNYGITLAAYLVNNSENATDGTKDLLVLLNSFVLAMIIVIFHSYFTTIIAVMILPLFCATLICDKKMYLLTGICVSFGALAHIYLLSNDYMNAPGSYYILNFGVVIIIICGIYYIGRCYIIALKNVFQISEKEKENIIKENWNVIHDENSNLYNYIAFRARLKDMMKLVKEGKNKNLTLAYFEIDNYKNFELNYSKDVLQGINLGFDKVLENEISEKVYISKLEENSYSIIFNDLSINEVINKLNSIKENIYRNENKLIADGNISFSTGVIEVDAKSKDSEILENCQKALKQAQTNGKNQTVIVR